jgi:hypothetical protein
MYLSEFSILNLKLRITAKVGAKHQSIHQSIKLTIRWCCYCLFYSYFVFVKPTSGVHAIHFDK